MSVRINSLTIAQLKCKLREHSLSTSGTKAQLVQRLIDAVGEEVESIPANAVLELEVGELRQEVAKMGASMAEIIQMLKSNDATPNSQTVSHRPEVSSENINNQIPQPIVSTPLITTSVLNGLGIQMSPYERPNFIPSVNNPAVRDIIEVLPEFNPSSELSVSVEQFVMRINNLIEVYKWDERVLLLAIYAKVKGTAKLWLDGSLEIHKTWQEFSSKLMENFQVNYNEADVHLKMTNCSRNQGERAIDFCHRISALGNRYHLSEAAIIKYARNGLKHPSLQLAIASTNFISIKHLIQTIESYLENRPSTSNNATFKYVNNLKNAPPKSFMSTSAKTPEKENRIRDLSAPKSSRSADMVCYNCFEKGHMAINCLKPQRRVRCSKCLRTNHSFNDCPEVKNQQPKHINKITSTEATTKLNSIEKASHQQKENEQESHRQDYNSLVEQINEVKVELSDNPMNKKIKVNNVSVEAFIDTGSDRSVIKKSVVQICTGQVTKCTPIKLKGFAGGEFLCDLIMCAELEIDGNIFESNLLIVDDHLISKDILLGTDILCKQSHRLVVEEGICRIEPIELENVKVGNTINEVDKIALLDLIDQYSYWFGENLKHLKKCNTTMMKIQLTNDKIIMKKPYRIPFAKRDIVNSLVQELLKYDIIRPSTSSYASPIVLVKKQNGEDRMCVDFRELNSITEKLPWPMPTVEEILSMLCESQFFTTLDLMSGYYQIEIEESSRKYTGFVTHNGHFEFNRMPFGLVNAPSVFQSMIMNLTQSMRGRVFSYVDEVVIPSRTIAEGLKLLKEFLELVKNAGLTLRLSKCVFLANEINFLGHQVDKNGLKPGKDKINAVYNFPVPKNITDVRRFLGLTGFFRKFVQNYSIIAKPLTELLKVKTGPKEFEWTERCSQAFQELITALCCEPVLTVYNPQKDHEVHTDASSVGIAGILLQRTDESKWRPVFYFSRVCTGNESRLHSYELELLAIVETLQRFRIYLLGKHFTIVTDCQAISTTKLTKPIIPKIARWWLKLAEYDYSIVHRSADRMKHVDALSRAPIVSSDKPKTFADDVMRIEISMEDWLYTIQMKDPQLVGIAEILKGERVSDQAKQIQKEYAIKQHRVYRKVNDELKIVVPASIRWRLVKHYHDDVGHPGVDRTIDEMSKHFWFARMRNYVKSFISACLECCYNKRPSGPPEGMLYGMNVVPVPFRILHIDHLGPFPKSTKGNLYVLGICDAFSKYVVLAAVRTTKTKPVISKLTELSIYFGLPSIIVSDRGSAFTSSHFESFCKENSIQHIKVAVRSPRSNGQIERVNQSVLSYLRTTVENSSHWDQHIQYLQWVINTTRNSTTGFSPTELIFDFDLRDITGNKLVLAIHQDDELCTEPVNMYQRRQTARENIIAAREKWKKRFDAKHKKPYQYHEGDLVVIEHCPAATGESRKLEPKYRGPYIISKVLRYDRYIVEDLDGAHRKQRKFSSVFNSEKLKPWCYVSPELDQPIDDEADDDEIETISMSGEAELSAWQCQRK